MRVVDVDARTLNQIANEPDMLVMIDPEAVHLDLSWMHEVPGSYVKGVDGINGAVAFLQHAPGNYELHYFMPNYGSLDAIRAIIDWMFTSTPVQRIFGATPRSNLAARFVNRWLGSVPVSTMTDGAGRSCIVYALTRDQWGSTLASRSNRLRATTKLTAS